MKYHAGESNAGISVVGCGDKSIANYLGGAGRAAQTQRSSALCLSSAIDSTKHRCSQRRISSSFTRPVFIQKLSDLFKSHLRYLFIFSLVSLEWDVLPFVVFFGKETLVSHHIQLHFPLYLTNRKVNLRLCFMMSSAAW